MTLFSRPETALPPPVARRSTDLALGLLVPPVLLGILASRALAAGLAQAGLASEQLFAGERLPNLKVPRPSTAPSADAATDFAAD